MKKPIIIAIVVGSILILVGVVGVFLKYASLGDPSSPNTPAPVPPPTSTTTDNGLWKTFTDRETGMSFSYPERLTTEFITASIWPPKVRVATGTLSCVEKTEDRGVWTRKRVVDDRSYCVEEENEGVAGSTYTTYTYKTEKGGKIISALFTLRAVQCGNYDDPKKTACGEEREAFDLDSVVDRIVGSVTIGR